MVKLEQETIGGLDCVVVRLAKFTEPPRAALVLCHGYGAPATDLVPIAAELVNANLARFPNVVMIFPAAPMEIEPGYEARAWWPIDIERLQQISLSGEIRLLADVAPEELPSRRESINEIIRHVQDRWKIPDRSIFVGGFSQGAMLATDVMLHSPKNLGGLIVWSGSLINLNDWQSLVSLKSSFPVIQSHGMWDPILPFQGATALRELLQSGGHRVDFIGFQGPHTIPAAAINAASNLLCLSN